MRLLALLLLSWLSLGSVAAAQAKVTVADFSGPRAKRLRGQVVEALDGEVELLPAADVEAAADSLGVDVTTPDGRTAVGRELGVSAYVEGSVEKRGKRSTLTLTVFDASSGGEVGSVSIKGRTNKLSKIVRRKAWDELGGLIGGTSVPEPEQEPEPEPEEEVTGADYADEDEDDDADDDAGDDSEAEGPGLVVSAGLRLGSREFDYPEEGNLGGLPNYTLAPWGDEAGVTPAVSFGLQLYPLAFAGGGFASNLGLDVRGEFVFGVDSVDPLTDETYATNAMQWSVDARMRFPGDGLEPALVLGYGVTSYEIESSPTQPSPVPAVAYGSLRFGGDLRLGLGESLALELRLVGLLPMGFGELGEDDWFPGVSGLGMESELRAVFLLSDGLEAFLGLGYDRYGLTLDPQVGDAGVGLGRVAGGALDQYTALRVGLAYRL